MRSTEEWRRRADEDAMFAVASHPGKEGGAWEAAAFYELGRVDWADFEPRWAAYAGSLHGTVLEIGCGAGRITKQLAQTFDHVVGLDVSKEMLRLTSEAVPEAELHLVDDVRLPVTSQSVDAVFTCHVWQHYEEQAEVNEQIRECFEALRPEGTLMAHLLLIDHPVDVVRGMTHEARRRVQKRLHPARSHTQVRRYAASTVRAMFEGAGFEQVELHEFRVRSNHGLHPFWFARRPL